MQQIVKQLRIETDAGYAIYTLMKCGKTYSDRYFVINLTRQFKGDEIELYNFHHGSDFKEALDAFDKDISKGSKLFATLSAGVIE